MEQTEPIPPAFRFSGQHTDEVILYVSRMHPIALIKNILLISLGFAIIAAFIAIVAGLITLPVEVLFLLPFLITVVIAGWLFTLWWAYKVYRNTYFVITDRRLVKLGYTTPFTRYQSSLNLSEIQDSAATSRHVIEQLLNIGTFYARSSAAGIRDFWFEYLEYHIDLHNYINKLLYMLRNDPNGAEALKVFRPFIPKPAWQRY